MTTTPLTLDPIKTKHRAMWALGNYDNVATEVIQASDADRRGGRNRTG